MERKAARHAARPGPRSAPSVRPGYPLWTAPSRAASATTVLPEPTSPCSSRCIGKGPARSATIRARARRWALVSSKGRPARKRVTKVPSLPPVTSSGETEWRRVRALVSKAWRRMKTRSCRRSNSSKTKRLWRRAELVHIGATRGRGWPRMASVLPQQVELVAPPALRQRVDQLAGPGQGIVDEGADLPAGQPGLGRGRVHRQDAERAASPADHIVVIDPGHYVDHRIHHLAGAAVLPRLAPEDGLGADGQLAGPPGLPVEEDHLQRAGLVAHRDVDHGAPVAGLAGACVPAPPRPARPPHRPRRAPRRWPGRCDRYSGPVVGRW